jgi:bud site selection protein 31
MFYKYKKISRQVYDYCIKMKLVDANLIAKWKKPGYERLCSTFAINTKNYNYGTVSICRVPRQQLSEDQAIQEKHSGCRGCASGPGGYHNIFGNKYGQYLARIQIAREEKEGKKKQEKGASVWATEEEEKYNSDYEELKDSEPASCNKKQKQGEEETGSSASDESSSESENSTDEEEEKEPQAKKKKISKK